MAFWRPQGTASVHSVRRPGLAAENHSTRQQLALFNEKRPRPRPTATDRASWATPSKSSPDWRRHLTLAKPEPVVGQHRKGFRPYWRRKSRSRRAGRPRASEEIRDLVQQMAGENHWRAPRIHAELLKLGFDVDARTVSQY